MTTFALSHRGARWSAHAALGLVLALAAFVRLWKLDQNGFGRQYYAGGVRSMMDSAHAFFYNAADPAGFVSIDKPPVALWLQVLSAKLLGFSAFSVLATQVVLGVLSVGLLHRLVARHFGRGAALVAALGLAVMPISVAVDRSNNTESALTLVLLLAAWALLRATERASWRALLLAMALVGVGFNVKMAAALVLAPTLGLVYFMGAGGLSVRQRLIHLAGGAAVLVAVALSWTVAFDLTPPGARPWAGSTQTNSMAELTLMHNGLNRFTRSSPPPKPRHQSTPYDGLITAADLGLPEHAADDRADDAAPLWDQSAPGLLRLLSPFHAAQVNPWFPLVLAAMLLGAPRWRRGAGVLTPAQSGLLLWGGWALSYALVFGLASGVFHTYYLGVMAPPLAALSGIGWAALWRRDRAGWWRFALPAALVLLALWQFYIERDALATSGASWHHRLFVGAMGVLLLAALGLAGLPERWRAGRAGWALAGAALAASLVVPVLWAMSVVLVRPNVAAPYADVGALLKPRPVDPEAVVRARAARENLRRLVGFLRANRGTERFLVAVPSATLASPLIARAGESVMTLGGYLGRDPILTPDDLERRVAAGEVRFVVLGGPSLVPLETTAPEQALARWVRGHGVPVPPELWSRGAPLPPRGAGRLPAQLYDLRPPPNASAYRRPMRSSPGSTAAPDASDGADDPP